MIDKVNYFKEEVEEDRVDIYDESTDLFMIFIFAAPAPKKIKKIHTSNWLLVCVFFYDRC